MDHKNTTIWAAVMTAIAVGAIITVIVLAVEYTKLKPHVPSVGTFQCTNIGTANTMNSNTPNSTSQMSTAKKSKKLSVKTNTGKQLTATTPYRQCTVTATPVPGGYATAAECQAQCSTSLPTSISSGEYFIQVGKPGDSTFGYIEPFLASDGNYYLQLVQQTTWPWVYSAPSSGNLGTGTLTFTSGSIGKPLYLGLTTIVPTGPGEPSILIPTGLTTTNASASGWVLTTDNLGQIFYSNSPNGQNCLTLQSIANFGYVLGPCFPSSTSGAAASGFSFVTGGDYACNQVL